MLPLSTRFRIWLRLLLLQSTWSYRRMQTCGWLWAAMPGLSGSERRRADLLRQASTHFNTHPMLAPLIVGAALSELHRDPPDPDAAREHLTRWMGTFGALGDMLYWQGLSWCFAGASVLLWLAGGTHAVLALAAAWLVGEGWLRWWLLNRGIDQPENIAETMKLLAKPRIRRGLNNTGLATGLFGAGILVGQLATAEQDPLIATLLVATAALAGAWIGSRSLMRSAPIWFVLASGLAVAAAMTGG